MAVERFLRCISRRNIPFWLKTAVMTGVVNETEGNVQRRNGIADSVVLSALVGLLIF